MRASLLASLALGFLACTDDVRPEISTQGLGQPCPAEGCIAGQVCVTAAAPGGETRSCEIQCDADRDCPRDLFCNLPPIVPDSLANVCVTK
ncbi:MAG TPA: hypothetical protein VK932_28435 [Kofleriaceae bacterium]|nr:hypothetical protein [Kofleriaceae bacterium]